MTKIYEDEKICAIMDVRPVNPGHILVFPSVCVPLMTELDDEILSQMMTIARKINKALRNSGLRCEGVNLLISDGKAAGQEIPHCHLHLIPRFNRDVFGLRFPDGYPRKTERQELDDNAEKIKKSLGSLLIE